MSDDGLRTRDRGGDWFALPSPHDDKQRVGHDLERPPSECFRLRAALAASECPRRRGKEVEAVKKPNKGGRPKKPTKPCPARTTAGLNQGERSPLPAGKEAPEVRR